MKIKLEFREVRAVPADKFNAKNTDEELNEFNMGARESVMC